MTHAALKQQLLDTLDALLAMAPCAPAPQREPGPVCGTCRHCAPIPDAVDYARRCEHEESPLANGHNRLTEDEIARWGCVLHEGEV